MRRLVCLVAAAAVLPAVAVADGGWPEAVPGGWNERGPGGGLALVPLAAWWLCVLGWAATVDWVSRDARKHKFRPALWSTIVALPLAGMALAAWWIPSAIAAILLMVAAWLGPAVAYAVLRNRQVPEPERILGRGHARRILAGWLGRWGIEIADPGDDAEVLPAVKLLAAGGRDATENAAREERAAATPGREEAEALLQAAVVGRAMTLLLEPDAQGIRVRHEVDGVWEKPRVRKPPRSAKEREIFAEAPPLRKESALAATQTLAALCGLPKARAGRTGTFTLEVDGKPRNCRLSIREVSVGEQTAVQIEPPPQAFKQPADVGMPAGLAERLGGLLALEKGLLVISAPPASGLTTTFDVVLQTADRLVRDFISIEDAAAPPREIQNVRPVRFDARTGVAPLDVLAAAMREYPRAIVTRDLQDQALAVELARLAADSQFVIVSMKASDAVDAVARLLAFGIPADVLARTLLGSLSQRLVRRLCPKCREDYPTPAEVLARLKTTAEKLPHLRKPSAHGCRLCRGTGYLGRTAVFELASGSSFRQAIAAKAERKLLLQAASTAGMQRMREAALALVADGVTSLEEMQRVFASDKPSRNEEPRVP